MAGLCGPIAKDYNMRDIQLFLERIGEYPHALDHEQVTRPVKGAQQNNTKTGKGVKRPMENELYGGIDADKLLVDNPEYALAWEAGLFDIGPTRPYGKSKDVQILHGAGLPDSHEKPNTHAQEEEFLQSGIVRINRKEENAGMSLDFDTELKCDVPDFINNGFNVVGSTGRKDEIKTRPMSMMPMGDTGTRKNVNLQGHMPEKPVKPVKRPRKGASVKAMLEYAKKAGIKIPDYILVYVDTKHKDAKIVLTEYLAHR